MKNAIIFDLDGTLWDSSRQVTESWNVVLGRYPETENSKITTADMHRFMGRQMNEIARMMMPDVEEALRSKIMLECMDYELEYLLDHKGDLYPKVYETLSALSEKFMLMIVSNCQDGYIQLFLKQTGIGRFFGDFESFGKTGLSKGENIKLVIKRNAVDRAVYVGDTQGDLDSADKAGVEFIHAAYGFGKTNRETARITEFSELTKILADIL